NFRSIPPRSIPSRLISVRRAELLSSNAFISNSVNGNDSFEQLEQIKSYPRATRSSQITHSLQKQDTRRPHRLFVLTMCSLSFGQTGIQSSPNQAARR